MMRSVVSIVVIATTLFAHAYTNQFFASKMSADGSTWVFGVRDDLTAEITDPCNPPVGRLEVPSTITSDCPIRGIDNPSLSVVGICDYAFSSYDGITSVFIPESIKFIRMGAFANCTSLVAVEIPDSVEIIDAESFSNCSESLYDTKTIPGLSLVDGWVVLSYVNLPDVHTGISGGQDFQVSGELDLTGVRGIEGGAFRGCTEITSVRLSANIKSIGDQTFYGCTGLRDIKVPKEVTYIGAAAFARCSGITNITFEGDAPDIKWNSPMNEGPFSGVAQDCVVHVRPSSSGWGTPIPGTWHGLRIEYLDGAPQPQTHTVTFDLGEHGVRTGGGELVQTVAEGEAALAPSVAIKLSEMGWWKFVGWNASIGSITSNLVANAVYEECVPDDAVLYIYNTWIEAGTPEDRRKGLGWTLRPAPPSDWTWTNVVFQGKERLRDSWQDMPYGCLTNYCRAVLQIESMVNGAPMTRTLVSRNVLFENVPADDADSRDWDAKISASLPVWEIMGGESLLSVTNGQTACFEYVFYNFIYSGFTHYGMVSAIITDPDGKSDCIGIDMEGNIGFLWWTAPDRAGQYTLSYVDEMSDMTVATCRIDVVLDVLPQLSGSATEAEIAAALDGAADERLGANITNATQYTAFRDWALSITNGSVTVQTVVDSSQAWLSFALGANGLVPEVLTSDDIKIESFKPAAADGDFAFEVSIADVGVGSGVTITDANRGTVIDNIKKVLTVEGAATLAPNLFSSDNIEVTFDTPAEGRARFTATPATNVGNTFFMRVKVR